MRHFLPLAVLLFSLTSVLDAEAQCLSGDCENGTGVAVHKEGWTYSGPFQDGLYHGDGLILRDDSMVAYRGIFETGVLSEGRYVTGGDDYLLIYDGQLENYQRQGEGRLLSIAGDGDTAVFEGSFEANRMTEGRIEYPSDQYAGAVFEGTVDAETWIPTDGVMDWGATTWQGGFDGEGRPYGQGTVSLHGHALYTGDVGRDYETTYHSAWLLTSGRFIRMLDGNNQIVDIFYANGDYWFGSVGTITSWETPDYKPTGTGVGFLYDSSQYVAGTIQDGRFIDSVTTYTDFDLERYGPLTAYASILKGKNGASLAIPLFSKALIDRDTVTGIRAERMDCYRLVEQWSLCLADALSVLDHRPRHANALNCAGQAYYYLDSFDRAVEMFDALVDRRPDLADPYYMRGRARMEQEAYKKAVKDFDAALAIDSTGDNLSYYRAKALEARGKTADACAEYARTLRLDEGGRYTDEVTAKRAELCGE